MQRKIYTSIFFYILFGRKKDKNGPRCIGRYITQTNRNNELQISDPFILCKVRLHLHLNSENPIWFSLQRNSSALVILVLLYSVLTSKRTKNSIFLSSQKKIKAYKQTFEIEAVIRTYGTRLCQN